MDTESYGSLVENEPWEKSFVHGQDWLSLE